MQVYTLFGILFLAFVLLSIVTSFVVIALTYFQLAVEDHKWYALGVGMAAYMHACRTISVYHSNAWLGGGCATQVVALVP